MTIQFVTEAQASQANATLSDALIQELTDKCGHPVATHKGLGRVILPTVEGELKTVVNKKLLHHHSPARTVVTDQETIDKIVAELDGTAPKVAKASKKKS